MTFEQFVFAAIIGLPIFFLGMCRANFFFYSNSFRKGGGGVQIGSICVSP